LVSYDTARGCLNMLRSRESRREEPLDAHVRAARPALVDGSVGAVRSSGGRPRVVFDFTIRGGKIVAIDMLADPEQLDNLDLTSLDD